MKKLTIFLLVLALAYPIGWAFAQEKETIESLKVDLFEAQFQAIDREIRWRQSQIATFQQAIQRLQLEITDWQQLLGEQKIKMDEARKALKKMNEEKEKGEPEAKPKKKP